MASFNEANGLKAIAQTFFSAYDAHDVDTMVALCADGASGRYLPLGRNSVMPIRDGIDNIWRAFPKAVPLFRVEVVEMMLAEGSTVIVQAIMSGPIPADPLGIAKDGEDVHIGHCYVLRYDPKGKVARLDCYWDNAVLNGIIKSKL